MNVVDAADTIKRKFIAAGSTAEIPMRTGKKFTAVLHEDGVMVSNLGNYPFLPWAIFQEAICCLIRNGGTASIGAALSGRLGDPKLPLDSIDGHIAQVVYGQKVGDSVFRRSAPVSAILVWAGLCKPIPGGLTLEDN